MSGEQTGKADKSEKGYKSFISAGYVSLLAFRVQGLFSRVCLSYIREYR